MYSAHHGTGTTYSAHRGTGTTYSAHPNAGARYIGSDAPVRPIPYVPAYATAAAPPLLSKPGSAGTIRLRQWSTGELDAIAFYRIDP